MYGIKVNSEQKTVKSKINEGCCSKFSATAFVVCLGDTPTTIAKRWSPAPKGVGFRGAPLCSALFALR